MGSSSSVLARFQAPTAERPTRVAVLSDLHLSLKKRGTWRVSHRTERRLETTVRSLNKNNVDGVMFNGDLVQAGLKTEFDAFDRIADRIEAPLFAVPGNHDLIDSDRPADTQLTLSEFETRYAPEPFPYVERVGAVDVVALNSNGSTHGSLTGSFEGRLRESTLAWLESVLEELSCPLVCVHHTLDPVREMYRQHQDGLPIENGDSPGFVNSDRLLKLLGDNAVPLVLTGHLHVPAVSQAGPVCEFTLPPLGPFPCGYTILTFDEHGVTATYHPVASLEERIEALGLGVQQDRVLMAAAQLAGLPLLDERSGSGD